MGRPDRAPFDARRQEPPCPARTSRATRPPTALGPRRRRHPRRRARRDDQRGDLPDHEHHPVLVHAPPAPRPSSTSSAPRCERSPLNGAELDPTTHFADSADPARRRWPSRTRSSCAPTGRFTNTGEGLHRFVDPVDDEVYLYTQFEVPDSRRMYPVFEQPDLKADFALHRHGAGALAGRLQLPHARAASRPARAPPPGPSSRTPRISSYITALVAGPYDVVRDSVTTRERRGAARHLLPALADPLPRRRQPLRGDQAGLRVLRGGVRPRLPVRQVRPALLAGVQHGRDGERRVRHHRRGLRLPLARSPTPSSSAARSPCSTSSPTCGSATS